jgi:hypothetical protein
MKVSERGRIPAALLEAYDAANKDSADATMGAPASDGDSAPVAKKSTPRKSTPRRRSPRKAKAPATTAGE